MADQEQLNKLQQRGTVWNAWRKEHPNEIIDLSGVDLSFADLSGADLGAADLSGANLGAADFSLANLSGARLSGADLSGTRLSGACLSFADLSFADLSRARLSGADLSGAQLSYARLSGADLSGAQLSRAIVAWPVFGSLDLCMVKGLETIQHHGPSEISTSTLERSNGGIPDIFLRGAGLSNESISYARSFLQHPIQYYSCFLSYSSTDQEFAERLYADLQHQGTRCWFAHHSLKIGDHFPNHIEEAIRVSDKLLLILSESSVRSEWVEDEVRAALEKEERFRKEQHQERTVLFPIQIDSTIKHASMQWAAKLRRTRHIGNFTRWKDHDTYLESFQRLMRDLQQAPTKDEPPHDRTP